MSTVGSVASAPPADPAGDANGPDTQSWQASAQAAAQQQATVNKMMGFGSEILMMPLIMQAMNPDQDDS